MPEESQSRPLITSEDVLRWVDERNALATQYRTLVSKLSEVQRKLDLLSQILPADVVSGLIGPAPEIMPPAQSAGDMPRKGGNQPLEPKSSKSVPITDAVETVLASQVGGRTPGWIRNQLLQEPAFTDRVKRTPTSVSNALLRLMERGKVLREDGLYYHPSMYAKIKSGELEEERLENTPSLSFNSVMHRVMRERGGSFTAGDAIAAAKDNEFLREKLEEQPSRVYSWLSREVFRHKLQKDGEYYHYPSEGDGAPNGSAVGAPSAGEVAASPIENQQALRLAG